MTEQYRPGNSTGENFTRLNLLELQIRRRKLFSQYFQLAEHTAKQLNQPVRDVIGEDLANTLLPQKIKEDQVRKYRLETPYGNFTYDAATLTATSPFLQNGKSETISPIEAVILETLLRQPTRIFRHRELSDVVDVALDRQPLPNDHTIRWHISNLRKKLGIAQSADKNGYPIIKNIPRIGYVFLPESDSEATSEN